jgi:hypothetical protein
MITQSTTAKHQRTVLKGKDAELDPMPDFPKPRPEHDWLHQLLGEWETEMACGPGSSESGIKSKGTERVWSIGDLWIVAESKSEVMNKPMTSVLTLGYDLERKRYVGTWIGSSTAYLWHYTGSLDQSGRVLTLETEGPCPHSTSSVAKFKEVMQVQSKDQRVLTSSMQALDGRWVPILTINYRRKG